jgi:4-amino-4-deoxy-L-arabinose transferase-like glycosyltransferase
MAADGETNTGRLLLALILAFVVTRIPFMLHGFDISDEALWMVVTNRWLDGGRLYVDAFERRPPLLFLVYAAVLAPFGHTNVQAVHVAAVVWMIATMLGLNAAARRLFGARAGVVAAALYAIYACWGDYTNLAWNGELLLNLPLVLALAVTFRPSRSRLRPELAAAGALVACAFLLKQPAAAAAVALGIYLLLPAYRRARGLRLADSLAQAALFSVGFAAVIAFTAWRLRAAGVFDEAMYWIFRHHDMPHGPLDIIFWERLEVAGVWFLLACFPLVAAAVAALSRRGRWVSWEGKEAERATLWMLLAASLLGVSASGRFYLHYFDLLVPPLALAAAPVVAALLWGETTAEGIWPLRPRSMRRALAATALVFVALQTVGLAKRTKGSDAGQFVKTIAAPGDEMFVWGELARTYLDAGVRPATRYVACYALTGFPYGGSISYDPVYPDTTSRIVPGTWEIFERELRQSRPRFFVDVEAKLKKPRYPLGKFPWLGRYVAENYRKVHEARDGIVYERVSRP